MPLYSKMHMKKWITAIEIKRQNTVFKKSINVIKDSYISTICCYKIVNRKNNIFFFFFWSTIWSQISWHFVFCCSVFVVCFFLHTLVEICMQYVYRIIICCCFVFPKKINSKLDKFEQVCTSLINSDQVWSSLNKSDLFWTNLIHLNPFDPFWSNLIQFDQVWCSLNKFDEFGSSSNQFEQVRTNLI